MTTRAKVERSAQRKLVRRLRARYQQIQPAPIQGMFNFRCHENCVQFLRDNPDRSFAVCEVITVEDGEPALHYVLRDTASGAYLEVTLGWRIEQAEVYLVRELLDADHIRIHSEFLRSREDWTSQFISRFWRTLFGINYIL